MLEGMSRETRTKINETIYHQTFHSLAYGDDITVIASIKENLKRILISTKKGAWPRENK